jgi:hypothetical protein
MADSAHSVPAVTELADLPVVADDPPLVVDRYLDNFGLFGVRSAASGAVLMFQFRNSTASASPTLDYDFTLV